jgi:hypothetical protein
MVTATVLRVGGQAGVCTLPGAVAAIVTDSAEPALSRGETRIRSKIEIGMEGAATAGDTTPMGRSQ